MKQILLKTWLMLVCLIVIGGGSAWAETYTGTVASSSGNVGSSFTLNNVSWNVTTTNGAGSPTTTYGNAYSQKCIKFGSGASNCYGSVSLSTDYFKDNSKKVTKVEINALGSAKKNVTFSIGTSTMTQEVAANTWTKLTLDNLNITGTLQLSFNLNSAGFFINQIVVTYEASGGSTATPLSVPTNLSSSNVTSTGATLSWDAVANASSYKVKIGSTEYDANTNSYSATGLTASTQYTWSVKAIGDGTNYSSSDYAANANFTTEAPASHKAYFYVNGALQNNGGTDFTEGASITFPADPSVDGVAFVGWTKTNNYSNATDAPSDLCKAATMGDADVTYYAVFATAGEGGGEQDWTITSSDLSMNNSSASSGYDKYKGDQTKDGFTVNITDAYPGTNTNNGKIQFKSSTGVMYNKTSFGNITKIEIVGGGMNVYQGNSQITSASELTAITKESTPSSPSTYIFSTTDNNGYFLIKNGGSTSYLSSIKVYYNSTTYSDYCTKVVIREISSIAVETAPTTVNYYEGEKFNPEGLKITVNYTEGEPEVVAYAGNEAKFTFSPALDADLTAANTQVTITYKNNTCQQAISVRAVSISAPVAEGGSYTVKVGDAEAVTADGSTIAAKKGQKIVLASTPATGYKLHSTPFVVKDEDDSNVSVSTAGGQYSFTMPDKNVTITAQFTPVYTITAGSCEHGSITAIKDKDDATITETSKGSKVVVETTADTHYHLTSMYYVKEGEETQNTISESEGVYSFTMPQSNVTVYAEFVEDENVTITWSINGNTDRTSKAYVGEAIVFPTDVADIEGKVFRGWVGETNKDYTNATDAPTYANAGTVNATAAATYYAVFATAIPGEDEEKTSSLTLNNGNVTSPYSNQDVTWNFSGLTFCNSNQQTSGMPNGASVSFTLPENAKAETFTITSTSNSWSTSNISLSLKYGETQITSFNNAGTYDFTESNNDKGAYSLTASNQSSKVAYIKTLSIKYLVPGTSYSDYCTTVKTTPTLSFAASTYNVTLIESFAAPELNNPQDVTITFSSSDTDVATVDAGTGTVTLVGAGNTTITATFAGNDRYYETSASYKLVVAAATATITIASACTDGETCYSTYSNANAFVVPEGLTVSVVGVDAESKLVVNSYKEGDVVAANTGVMVSGTAGDHVVTLTNAAATDAPGTNNLHPSSEEMTGDNLFYRLTMHNGKTIGFWWGAEGGAAFDLAANKAYLAVPKSAGSNLRLWFGDDTLTGIDAVETSTNDAIFNLQGQRINRVQKGVNIVNGKKVLR